MRQDADTQINRVIALVSKHLRQGLTQAEEKELNDWASRAPENERLLEELTDHGYQRESFEKMDRYDEPAALGRLRDRIGSGSAAAAPGRRRWPLWAAAAAVAALAVTLWLARLAPSKDAAATAETFAASHVDDAAPGSSRAVLILAGGRTIILDSARVGQLALQGATRIVKLNSGAVACQPVTQAPGEQMQYNTLTTPRGGEYQLELPDGTRVWLNAASSIRFPAAFTGTDRRVSVTGEAYFEVAPDVEKPFIVEKGKTEVRVLGTHFDLDAYEDESDIRVTLLEGAVQVSSPGAARGVRLAPGEQLRVGRDGGTNLVKDVNVNRVVAWKNGRFAFSGNIREIMREIARWYDVKVTYQGDVTDKDFEGTISKYEYVSRVLEMLEMTGSIHFSVKETPGSRKVEEIIVKP
jgi:ferric-dicitrate binding protein FerR (iron transport regulator)